MSGQTASSLLLLAVELVVLARAILRPHRQPASRFAWALVIIVAPVVGAIGYLLLGEARIGGRRRERGMAIDAKLGRPTGNLLDGNGVANGAYEGTFRLAASINGLGPTGGNRATLAADSNCAIDGIVNDIDSATTTVHACYYIWLADGNGLKVKDACLRAAGRGVEVRVLADAFGSRELILSKHWQDLREGGVAACAAIPLGNPLMTILRGRLDLRNHRKLTIIDNRIAWIGSQNTADPEFRIKPHYAPWVDIMTRWEGLVAQQCQYLFVSDWLADGSDDPSHCLSDTPESSSDGITAQVFGTGPTLPYDAMPSCFASLIHSAREQLTITTPYFVPDEQILFALTAAARRGVATRLILPARVDSRFVAATCKSYYRDLVAAGVELYEYHCGLLHAKTMVADRTVSLIGSANLDRRSFELNFENNILFTDPAFAGQVMARQADYLADSRRVTMEDIERFTLGQRLWQNSVAMLSPLL